MKVMHEVAFYAGFTVVTLILVHLQARLSESEWGSKWLGLPALALFLLTLIAVFGGFFLHNNWFGESYDAIENRWLQMAYAFGPIIWASVVVACYQGLVQPMKRE
jgi:hypothetical protein